MSAREKYFRAETVPQKAQADAEISSALKSLFALVENYPQLKSDARFAALQERITHLEEGLSDRREFYNDSVNNYNIRIQQIPDCFVAAFLYLRKEPLFKASSEDRKDVAIKFRSSN
jgi:LemA protein